ncbi:MAG: DUF2794 domain-containing protein [Alphaproteobacteria bacterium]
MTEVIDFLMDRRQRASARFKPRIFFNRHEMRLLLDVYSRRVASGEWRDYAMDQQGNCAVFSIFRHSYDAPLFSVTKRVDGRRCDYLVFSGPQKLKQAASLADALAVFDRPIRLVSRRN